MRGLCPAVGHPPNHHKPGSSCADYTDDIDSDSDDVGDDFFTKGSYPKVNVINCDKAIEIEASIPGLTKKE